MEQIRAEIEALLGRSKGRLSPRRLYEWAMKNPGSAVHGWLKAQGCFERAEDVARRFGVLMAGRLMRTVKVTIVSPPSAPLVVRVLTSLPADRGSKEGSYRSTARVLASEVLRSQLVAGVAKDLLAIRENNAHLHELAGVWEAIDGLRGRQWREALS